MLVCGRSRLSAQRLFRTVGQCDPQQRLHFPSSHSQHAARRKRHLRNQLRNLQRADQTQNVRGSQMFSVQRHFHSAAMCEFVLFVGADCRNDCCVHYVHRKCDQSELRCHKESHFDCNYGRLHRSFGVHRQNGNFENVGAQCEGSENNRQGKQNHQTGNLQFPNLESGKWIIYTSKAIQLK